jgi:Uncharacterized protein conserved in bacteria
MKLVRRQLPRLIAGVAVLPIFSRVASALHYPSQPVRLIVPYAPGGTTDTVARQIGPWLSERLAQAFVIESRPGAGTNVGTDAVAHAAPDGNTLLLFDPSAAINATLCEKLNSILFATSLLSFASSARRWSSWSIRRLPPKRFLNSSPMPKPTRAGSTWRLPASAARLS